MASGGRWAVVAPSDQRGLQYASLLWTGAAEDMASRVGVESVAKSPRPASAGIMHDVLGPIYTGWDPAVSGERNITISVSTHPPLKTISS
jgi:hypothetical protein